MSASGLLSKVLKTFVGSKTDRDYKELSPIIDDVATIFSTLSSLTNDELRARTTALKTRIKDKTKENDEKIIALKEQIETDNDLSIADKEELYNQIDTLDKETLTQIEEVLDEIKAEAFAIVKETLCGNRSWRSHPGGLGRRRISRSFP